MIQHRPVGLPRVVAAWQQAADEGAVELVKVVCGRGNCSAYLGTVLDTPALGAVLRSFAHLPVERAQRVADAALEEMVAGPPFASGQEGPLDVRRDRYGQLDALEEDDYWHRPVFGCPKHGAASADRPLLVRAVVAARRAGRRVEVRVASGGPCVCAELTFLVNVGEVRGEVAQT